MNKTNEQLIEETEGLVLDIIWLLKEETKNVNLIDFQNDDEKITKCFFIEDIDKNNIKDKSYSIQYLYRNKEEFNALISSGETINIVMSLISHVGKNQTSVEFSYVFDEKVKEKEKAKINEIKMSEQLLNLIRNYNNLVLSHEILNKSI